MQVKEEHFKDHICSSKIAAGKTNIHHIKAKPFHIRGQEPTETRHFEF
jgi:hypothetical protein